MAHPQHPLYEWLLNHSKTTLTRAEIAAYFSDNLDDLLSLWISDGWLCQSKRHDFYIPQRLGMLRAQVIRIYRSNYVVSLLDESGEYTLPNDDESPLIYNDEVLINPVTAQRATLYRVYRRNVKTVIGNLYLDRHYYVDADEKQLRNILIKVSPSRLNNARPGDKVKVELLPQKVQSLEVEAQVIDILGDSSSPWVSIDSVIQRASVPIAFSEDTLQQLETIERDVQDTLRVPERKDYSDIWVVTIDGEDAKDFDDAVSVEVLENGNYSVGVHIADVSTFVQPNTLLDTEARKRGTSIYFANRVIPMLPEKLSNDLCSLRPRVERLTITCLMEVNDQGEVVNYDIHPSKICSHARLTYTSVNRLFHRNQSIDAVSDSKLFILKSVADLFRQKREMRGALDLDVNESYAVFNADKDLTDVKMRDRGPSEMMIEDLMIAANEIVAEHITYLNRPMIYRIHPKPKQAKLEQFSTLFAPLGYKIKGDIHGIHPFEIQRLLKKSIGQPEHDVIAKVLLRSLTKAVYYPDNQGHFGLASECYTHFTSPIRRYPDLIVHRLLWRYWTTQDDDQGLVEELLKISESSSLAERKAQEIERDADDVLNAWWMTKHQEDIFLGVVSGFNSSGFYVELPNTVEGMIKFASMNDDYYEFDAAMMQAVGQATKRIIRLGDKYHVRSKWISIRDGLIEFTAVKRFDRVGRKSKNKI